eukprot:TRINITY_DN3386_c0_g4_i1.p1 TRINITY_DN3386_c0_g4~~TRINITY_DN3386_c0_g4_i1.p1  ORF type:complete len:131 (-),score=11.22 TRINITY_DN3386_c0_g4_i1:332-724(-)
MFHYHRNTVYQHYHPKKLFIITPHLQGLLTNPFLSNVREITFPDYWAYPLTKLPNTVTHINFGYHFDGPVSTENLPPRLTHLKFGRFFHGLSHRFHQMSNKSPFVNITINVWTTFQRISNSKKLVIMVES